MGKTKILENWTFTRSLPAPFDAEVLKRGKKDSTEEACLSVHNKMTRGRRSTLNSVTLRGMLLAADIINGERRGALGVETEKGQICRYYAEIVDSSGAGDEIRIFLYDPKKGSWRASVKKEKTMSPYPRIGENGASGKELFLLLAYASMILGPVYDGEFEGSFQTFVKEKAKGFPDMDLAMECAFLCCDNLYRRLENRDTLKEMGIPFHNDEIASGNVPLVPMSRFKKGSYKPTREDFGAFQVLKVKGEIETLGTVGELKSRYNRNFSLTENEKQQVPSLPDHYQVPAEVSEIVEAVLHTPMRVFMSAGESGTGKTTNAKMVAQLLGMPYYFFTCGEGTDETDLVSTMIPNIGRKEARPAVELPTFEDMIMDPASALACVCGSYEEEISQEEAFQRVLSAMYQTGFQNGQGEKDYVMVESSIVTACRRPSVIEIQEPSVITKPGTLVKLNGLLDDGAAITLTSGEVVRRNPETVILLTTNMGYKGCRGFNESVLSRMRMIHYCEPLTAKGMVERVLKRVAGMDKDTLEKMAETVCEIQKYCRTEMITGGVCGYREFEDWVWASLVQKDICGAAKRTVVAKAAPEAEEREEIYKTQILTKFEVESGAGGAKAS